LDKFERRVAVVTAAGVLLGGIGTLLSAVGALGSFIVEWARTFWDWPGGN
jgi:hypothetical protein